jgi:hypothetical protein
MTIATGYQRDAEFIFYVTQTGATYLVHDPESLEPLWRKCADQGEEYLSPDAETARLGADELAKKNTMHCFADHGCADSCKTMCRLSTWEISLAW